LVSDFKKMFARQISEVQLHHSPVATGGGALVDVAPPKKAPSPPKLKR